MHFASTIKNRTSHHTTKVFNRACKAAPKEKLFLKNLQRFKKNKKTQLTADTQWHDNLITTMVYNHGGQERQHLTGVWQKSGFSS